MFNFERGPSGESEEKKSKNIERNIERKLDEIFEELIKMKEDAKRSGDKKTLRNIDDIWKRMNDIWDKRVRKFYESPEIEEK